MFARVARLFGVALLLGGALSLRLWNLGFGLPDWYHPDEPLKARAVARMSDGHLHPGSFYHPSFMLYAAAITQRLAGGIVGSRQSAVGSSDLDGRRESGRRKGKELAAVLAGRIVVALLGTATVALTLIAGQMAAGAFPGWVAAVLLAIAPLHVICSHYLKEDVPLAFWSVAAFIGALHIVRYGRRRDYIATGLLAGLAAATKYVGVLFVALPWLAHRERGETAQQRPVAPRRQGAMLQGSRAALLASAAGFLLATPFALFDAPRFLLGVGHEGGNVFTGLAGIAVSPVPYLWTYHLRSSVIPGLGLIPTVLALWGFVLAVRRPQPAMHILTAVVFALYTVFECSPYKPPPNADRYVVPLLPFLAMFAGIALEDARTRLSIRSPHTAGWIGLVLLLVAMAGPFVDTIRLTAAMAHDTRAAAREWLVQHACGRGDILLEGAFHLGGTIVPSYVPVLPPECNAAYAYSLERDRRRLGEFDFVVTSSFAYDRFLRFSNAPAEARQFYRDFFATHQPLVEFAPAYRSYGFHNPTIGVYRISRR